jgi:TolB-like protein/DNA-binding winged helix-turn-helix (wHTH) protein/Tfp pilus assembly protein PilF
MWPVWTDRFGSSPVWKVFIVLSPRRSFFLGFEGLSRPFQGQIAASVQAWQWSEPDDSLTSRCLRKPLKQIDMSLPDRVPVECFLFSKWCLAMPADLVKFGDGFELDRRSYELRRSGRALKLERIPLDILFLLVERKGELISREDIIEKIWGRDVFLDTDSSINGAIRKIRHALKDEPENPIFVQTVTGKGYRFIATVLEAKIPAQESIVANLESTKTVAPEESVVPTPPRERRVPLKSWPWFLSLATLLAVLVVGFYGLRLRARSQPASEHRVMLAILPFANLSNDPEQEYFSDGLTEETITDLGELNPDRLGVIARTSAASYKHTNKTIAQIGRELGVDYILEGSVRREGGIARISAQLIRVKDQVHLWAHSYDRETGGLLALQNELGRAIAQQVQVKLAPPYGGRPTNKYAPNPDAYELYLKGRFYVKQRTFPEVDKSAEYFQRSIEKDPSFALAYAGLADSHLANAIRAPQTFYPKAKAAASRALELDDDLAEAHAALGAEKADFEYDWPGAEQEFKRAIELNPNYAEAHFRYAYSYLTPLGRSEQAIAEMKKALELDPFSRIYNTVLGMTYFYARKYDQAEEQFKKAVELNPDFFVTYYHRAWLYSQLGQYESAISELTKGRLLSGDERVKIAASEDIALRKALVADGARGFWQQILREEEEIDPEIGEFGEPQVYARLGDKQKALEGLERNYEERRALGTLLNVDPAFDSIRSDQRFVELVRRMGLTPSVKVQ